MTWLLAGCGLVVVAAFFGMLKLRAYSDALWAIHVAQRRHPRVRLVADVEAFTAGMRQLSAAVREWQMAFAPLAQPPTRWQRVRARLRRMVRR